MNNWKAVHLSPTSYVISKWYGCRGYEESTKIRLQGYQNGRPCRIILWEESTNDFWEYIKQNNGINSAALSEGQSHLQFRNPSRHWRTHCQLKQSDESTFFINEVYKAICKVSRRQSTIDAGGGGGGGRRNSVSQWGKYLSSVKDTRKLTQSISCY